MKKRRKVQNLGFKKKQQKRKKKVIYGWLVDPPISLKTLEAVVGRDVKCNNEKNTNVALRK